jgi:protein FrlC
MKISLSSFVYLNYPLEDTIRAIARAGYDGIDLWGGRPHCYRRDLSERELLALRRLIESEGLEVASLIPAQFRYPTSLCSPNRVIREDSVRYIMDSIENACILGAPVVSVCPGHSLAGQSRESALARLAESLWEIASFAARHNVRIAIEPADRYETDLLNDARQTADFIHQAGLANTGVLLDNGHEWVVNHSYAAIPEIQDLLFHVHVDDNQGQRDQHLVPGEGGTCVPEFLNAIQATGYDGFVCVELSWDYTLDPEPAARQSLKVLRNVIN